MKPPGQFESKHRWSLCPGHPVASDILPLEISAQRICLTAEVRFVDMDFTFHLFSPEKKKSEYLEGRLFLKLYLYSFEGMYMWFFPLGIVNINKKSPAVFRWGPSHFLVHLFQNLADRFLSTHRLKGGAWRKKKTGEIGRVLKQPSNFRYDQGQRWNFAFEKCRCSPIKMKISPIEGRSKQTVNADQWSCLHVFLAEKKGDLRTEVGRWGFGPKKSGEERKITREWGYQDVMPLQPQIVKDLFLGFRFGHLFLAPFLVGTCLSTRCLKGIWNRSETITSHTLRGGYVFFLEESRKIERDVWRWT